MKQVVIAGISKGFINENGSNLESIKCSDAGSPKQMLYKKRGPAFKPSDIDYNQIYIDEVIE